MAAPQRKHDTEASLPRGLIFDAVSVCEAAAIASAQLRGLGDEKAADQVAVDSMRRALNTLPIRGTIVIGEGERDEAPMLYIGETVGLGTGPAIDIALDPLEGTTITAKSLPGAMTTIAFATEGGFLHAPDVYMYKLAVGPDVPFGVMDVDLSVADNLARLAEAKGATVADMTVCILDRPRHEQLIADVRATGARISLIDDGDVSAVIAVADPNSGIDMYIGSGGAPEGVLAAAALRCLGGHIIGKLLFRNDEERARAKKAGITDLDRKYSTMDMASGHVLFAATGVTSGNLVQGVRFNRNVAMTHSVVMDSRAGQVRMVETVHPDYPVLARG
ncbi:MAG TPA: class II fructose-bisphosphatase [Alphaproteobacteria bacterium]|nr:class II fructose-bisphosphatase [Rhodospirillaceae bacterium]HRJ12076.1 class II fructose-bisphosphatase [Alphaproteobacteria bacterium]